jgi:hypothetical protein
MGMSMELDGVDNVAVVSFLHSQRVKDLWELLGSTIASSKPYHQAGYEKQVCRRSPDEGEEEEACQRLFDTLVDWRVQLEAFYQKPVVLQMVSFARNVNVDAMGVLFNLLAYNDREAVCLLFGIDFGRYFKSFGTRPIDGNMLAHMKEHRNAFMRIDTSNAVWYNQASDLPADWRVLSTAVQTLRSAFAWIDSSPLFGRGNSPTLEDRVQAHINGAKVWNLREAGGTVSSGQESASLTICSGLYIWDS